MAENEQGPEGFENVLQDPAQAPRQVPPQEPVEVPQGPDVQQATKELNNALWQGAADAGMPDAQIGALEDQSLALYQAGRILNTTIFTPDTIAVVAACARSLDISRSITAPPTEPMTAEARSVVRGIESVFGSNLDFEGDPVERKELENLLESYDLSLDKPRNLQLICDFKQIIIQERITMSAEELRTFTAKHPAHHLAIFSMPRTSGTLCFYVVDFVSFLRRAATPHRKNELSDQELATITTEQWHELKITNGNNVFTGEEIMMALEWYNAYRRLRGLLNSMSEEQRKLIIKFADSIKPVKPKGMVAGFFSRAARAVKQKLDGIWKLLSAKVLVDIISVVAGTVVFAYALGSVVTAGTLAAGTVTFWGAIKMFMLGSLVQQIYKVFTDVFSGGQNTWFGYIFSSISNALKLVTPAWVYRVFESCKQLFTSAKGGGAAAAIVTGFAAVTAVSVQAATPGVLYGLSSVGAGSAALVVGNVTGAVNLTAGGLAAVAGAASGTLQVGAGALSAVGSIGTGVVTGLANTTAAVATVASAGGSVAGGIAAGVGVGVQAGLSAIGTAASAAGTITGAGLSAGGAVLSTGGAVVSSVLAGTGAVVGALASAAIPIAAILLIGGLFMRWLSSQNNGQAVIETLQGVGSGVKNIRATSGVSSLLKMLAAGSPCDVVESVFGPTSGKVCRVVSRGAIIVLGFTMDLVKAIVDLLVLLVRAKYPDFVKGYKINNKFQSIFASLTIAQGSVTPAS